MHNTNRRRFLQQAAFGCLLAATIPTDAAEERKRLRVVTLEGEPAERGIQHGKALKEPIQTLVKAWKADLAARYKMEADAFIEKFVARTDYLPAIKKWTPDLLDEIRGIAKGAELDFETVLVFQLIDEYWSRGPEVSGEHCSAFGFSRRGDRPTYIAQNMDLEGFRDGFQTVLHIKYADGKREAFVLTNAGLIGLNGVNNRSLGICCNTLGQLANRPDGLPVACVVRGVLEQPTEETALNFLRKVPHASGQNYIVGGPTHVYDLECSAGKVVPFVPKEWSDRVWHTNHPLVNDDYTPQYRKTLEKGGKASENSATRLHCIEQRLAVESAKIGPELLRSTLVAKDSAAHPVCRTYRNAKENFTFASTIMVLTERPVLHVAPGPADMHPYQECAFGG